LRDDMLPGALPRLDRDPVQRTVVLQDPLGVADDILARLRVGEDFHPPLHAEQAADPAERDPLRAVFTHRVGRFPGDSAATFQARQAAAELRYCLISCATRSDTWAPFLTQ